MKLHKAFSSLITFPKIKENKKIYHNNKNIGSKDCFLTLNFTDDVNFAIGASNKLERKLILGKINNLRLLKRGNNNDIYTPNWTSNKKIFRNIKNNLNIETNDICFNTLDKNIYKQVFKTQTKNIFNSYLTAKNYKYMNQLKSKFLKLNTNTEKLVSNSKHLCFNNYISNLLQHERNKINTNEKEYQKSLSKEKVILNSDIKKFEGFQVNQNLLFQKSDGEVQKYIKANSIIYEAVKTNVFEYHTILNKIQEIIREIVNLEEIVLYVYKILGYDDSNLNLKALDNFKIITKATNQIETEQNIYKVFMQTNILINKFFDKVAEELNSDDEKIYSAINNKEKMILKKISEKDNINSDRLHMENEFYREIKYFKKKYDNYMTEYVLILKDYEEEIEKYKLTEKHSQMSSEFREYISNLTEIKNELFSVNELKRLSSSHNLIYWNLIIPCLEKLKQKESFVDDILNKMESYEKEDMLLFNKCITNCKRFNRKIKLKQEKIIIEDNEIQEKLRILKKHKKIIIKDKFKYINLPPKKIIKGSFSESKLKRK